MSREIKKKLKMYSKAHKFLFLANRQKKITIKKWWSLFLILKISFGSGDVKKSLGFFVATLKIYIPLMQLCNSFSN